MRRRMLLCTSKQKEYLEVEPKSVQWIDEYNPVDYQIKSNTKWYIH